MYTLCCVSVDPRTSRAIRTSEVNRALPSNAENIMSLLKWELCVTYGIIMERMISSPNEAAAARKLPSIIEKTGVLKKASIGIPRLEEAEI